MPDQTSQDMLNQWLQSLDQQGKSAHTLRAYQRGMQQFVDWIEQAYQEPFEPAKVTARDVRSWKRDQQREKGSAAATINLQLTAISRFFHWASQQNLSTGDPTAEVAGLTRPPRKPQALSEKALRRLLREAHDHLRDQAILEVLAGTGVRVGELLDLRIGDVEIGPRSGSLRVVYGKGGSYREVPLSLEVRKALSLYLEQNHPASDDPQSPLWVTQQGTGLSHRSSILRILEKYALRSGLERLAPHQFRHTFATRYLRANPDDLRGLARLLGHSSLAGVMIYTEPTMEDLAERIERMEAGT